MLDLVASNLYLHPLDTIEDLRPLVSTFDHAAIEGEIVSHRDERVPRGRILVVLEGGRSGEA